MEQSYTMRITLEHGSGGRKTDELIKRHFLRYFNGKEIRKMDDGANFGGGFVISTDTFVVNPVFFPGGNIGDLAVAGTVNDLVSMGAEPLFLTAGFVLEEGFDTQDLEEVLRTMSDHLERLNMELLTADTKVVEARDPGNPGIFINTTGIGRVYRELPGREGIRAGDVVIVTGAVGEHGFAVLAHRLNLSSSIKSDTKPLWGLIKPLLDQVDVKFMRDPTRGGLAQTLNEIVENMSFGIKIFENSIPLKDEVRGLSELLGIDPLEVANEGKMIVILPESQAEKAINILKKHPHGKEASVIGIITEAHPGVVTIENPYGAERILYKPTSEKLPRIC